MYMYMPIWFNPALTQPAYKNLCLVIKRLFAYAKTKTQFADQRLCFRYTDRTIPLLPKFQASSHLVW